MTGYAFLEKRTDQFSYSVSIKSLNSRYLEIYTNIPKILKEEEVNIEAILKNRFERGKVELNIDVFDWVEARAVNLDRMLIGKYYMELRNIEKELGLVNSFNLGTLLSMDGVSHRERTHLSDKSRTEIYKSLDMVIEKTHKMRVKEGVAIKKDLLKSLGIINKNLAEIKKITVDNASKIYERLKKNIEAIAESRVDDQRLYTEVALLADKLDTNEEKVRLDDHLKKFRSVLEEQGQLGKQLDFLAQEMFREINTIASKSNNSRISHLVVDMKNQIDKIREHCRNII